MYFFGFLLLPDLPRKLPAIAIETSPQLSDVFAWENVSLEAILD